MTDICKCPRPGLLWVVNWSSIGHWCIEALIFTSKKESCSCIASKSNSKQFIACLLYIVKSYVMEGNVFWKDPYPLNLDIFSSPISQKLQKITFHRNKIFSVYTCTDTKPHPPSPSTSWGRTYRGWSSPGRAGISGHKQISKNSLVQKFLKN